MFKLFVRMLAGTAAVLGLLSVLPMMSDRAMAQNSGHFRPNLPPRQVPGAIRPSPPGIFGQSGQAGVGGSGGVAGISGGTSGTKGAILVPTDLSLGNADNVVDIVFADDDSDGTLGAFDLGLRFKPPDGAGLSLQAGELTGSGFLTFDEGRRQYAGLLHLQVAGLNLNAVGLLSTRLPGGHAGFSLLVIITASGFAPALSSRTMWMLSVLRSLTLTSCGTWPFWISSPIRLTRSPFQRLS